MVIKSAGNNLFDNDNSNLLGKSQTEYFHTMVAKDMFLSNRERPDIQHTVAVLDTRVRSPNMIYWSKMVRVLKYLHFTRKYHLTLSIHDMRVINWYADTSFAVHPNFKSHTGGIMMWVPGENKSRSMKQKLNTISITEVEIVIVDNMEPNILWKELFTEDQEYNVENNILYQDNKSSTLLETNLCKSSGKRIWEMNMFYFFIMTK